MKKIIVSTAIDLTSAQQKKIAEAIKKKVANSTIEFKTDQTVIGGLSIKIDSQLLDGTLSHKLDTVKQALLQTQ